MAASRQREALQVHCSLQLLLFLHVSIPHHLQFLFEKAVQGALVVAELCSLSYLASLVIAWRTSKFSLPLVVVSNG
jgi:hypothetical protein